MNDEINMLYIENVKLKDHLKGGEASQSKALLLHSHTSPNPMNKSVDTKGELQKERSMKRKLQI